MAPSALIVHGGMAIHEPEKGARVVGEMLAEHGFSVTITDNYDAFGDPSVHETDLVVPVITGGQIAPGRLDVLVAAIANGTGLAGYHHCLATTFRDCVPFRYMAGCTWVAHPGDIITYRVDVPQTGDPITEGIESFEHTSEQYYLHYDPAVDVLATTTFSGTHHPCRRNVTMPVAYKTSYGSGRVFYSSLGHQAHELAIAPIRTILLRGLLWAAGARHRFVTPKTAD